MHIRDTLTDNTLHEVELDVNGVVLKTAKIDRIMLPYCGGDQDLFPAHHAMVMVCLRRSNSGPDVELSFVSDASYKRYGIECSQDEKLAILDGFFTSVAKKDSGLSADRVDIFTEDYILLKNAMAKHYSAIGKV